MKRQVGSTAGADVGDASGGVVHLAKIRQGGLSREGVVERCSGQI